MILRELLSVFGLEFDGRGAKQAERAMDRLKSQADSLANIMSTVLIGAAAVAPFILLSKLASDAEETLNLMGATFEENADDVVDWSNRTAKAMGRSKFKLREFAGNLGLVFRGMNLTSKEAAEMSTTLTELAVDFSSLTNFTEKEVVGAFRSGITGETESLKRLGIGMNETALNDFAMRRGIGKTVKQMSTAEKTQLRYQFLVEKAGIAQGDAAKTGLAFANATRRARDLVHELATELGLKFLPVATSIVNGVGQMLVGFRELAEGTSILEGALVAMGLIAAVVLLPLLIQIGPLLLAMALFAVVMDEVITTFRGGETFIKDFSDALDGIDAGKIEGLSKPFKFLVAQVNLLRDGLAAVAFLLAGLGEGFITGDFTQLERAFDSVAEGIKLRVAPFLMGLESVPSARRAGEFVGVDPQGRSVPQTGKMGGLSGAAAGAGGGVVFQQGDTSVTVPITQQPGEDSEELTGRVGSIVRKVLQERDQDMVAALVQRAQAQ